MICTCTSAVQPSADLINAFIWRANPKDPHRTSAYNLLTSYLGDVAKRGRLFAHRKVNRIIEKNGDLNVAFTNIHRRRLRYLADLFTTLIDLQVRNVAIAIAFCITFSHTFSSCSPHSVNTFFFSKFLHPEFGSQCCKYTLTQPLHRKCRCTRPIRQMTFGVTTLKIEDTWVACMLFFSALSHHLASP